jgi:transcriptional regulator with PAS, ATPase and Fis domain
LKKYSQTCGKAFQGVLWRAQIALLQHDWPGNVGELANVISSAAMTAKADFIDVCDLPENLQKSHQRIVCSENWGAVPSDDVR